jgi:hypothetical protein
MFMRQRKTLTAAAVFAALVVAGTLIDSKSGQAFNDNNGAQDEKEMIRTGLAIAASTGIHLNITTQDPDMVGLGSYLVNVVAGCNGCHAVPQTEYAPGGDPFFLPGAHPPFFSGMTQINPATYLGGNQDFGSFPSPGGTVHIVSRNLTPDKTGRPEGGNTLTEFLLIMRTGADLDHAHPNCPTNAPNCLFPPFNGDLLQVMPWEKFRNMTHLQLTAIYEYLSTIPCLEGGPGEPPNRCK